MVVQALGWPRTTEMAIAPGPKLEHSLWTSSVGLVGPVAQAVGGWVLLVPLATWACVSMGQGRSH
jgi:hypothetical protein